MEVKSCDYDNYTDYKREYDKQYRIKNKDKIKEQNKNKDHAKQYQKRKKKLGKTPAEYYKQKRLNNPDWVKEQNQKSREYKSKNKETLAQKTRTYKKTYQGKKSHKISEWRTRCNLKETPEKCELIFARWFYSKKCELCLEPYKTIRHRCMEHHHASGHFRHICCSSCNNKLGKVDRQRQSVLLELHRYFLVI
jgi:hypothetical protein